MNPDFAEVSELTAAGAEFLVVVAFAIAAHGNPRTTGGHRHLGAPDT
jgi:hypothetical protein